jgi:hypothetical protein
MSLKLKNRRKCVSWSPPPTFDVLNEDHTKVDKTKHQKSRNKSKKLIKKEQQREKRSMTSPVQIDIHLLNFENKKDLSSLSSIETSSSMTRSSNQQSTSSFSSSSQTSTSTSTSFQSNSLKKKQNKRDDDDQSTFFYSKKYETIRSITTPHWQTRSEITPNHSYPIEHEIGIDIITNNNKDTKTDDSMLTSHRSYNADLRYAFNDVIRSSSEMQYHGLNEPAIRAMTTNNDNSNSNINTSGTITLKQGN